MAIRSGRFTLSDAKAETKIIKGRAGAFYRILNSGKHAFTVKLRDSGGDIPLMPTLSVDVSTADDVKIVNHLGEAIEGIYDYLDAFLPVRSGRFKTEATGKDADEKHLIIDLTGGNDQAWYRLLNSGKNPIHLIENNTEIHVVGRDQSFDFEVGRSIRKIYVKGEVQEAEEEGGQATEKPIEGIYEFLGREV